MGAKKTDEEKQKTRDARNKRRRDKKAADKAAGVAAGLETSNTAVEGPPVTLSPAITGGQWYK